MLALLGNFDLTELLVIGVGALLIFGRRLPEVAMRAAAQVMRLRRAVSKMWREAGIEDELRRVRRDIEREVHSVSNPLEIHGATRRYDAPPPKDVDVEPAPAPDATPEAGADKGAADQESTSSTPPLDA